mgnify:CR=1 FL=1
MKILFICGSLEPGKDGVGDYTRRFCGELLKMNYEVQILSINDLHSISYINVAKLKYEDWLNVFKNIES